MEKGFDNETSYKKDFLWRGLRISFILMIVSSVILISGILFLDTFFIANNIAIILSISFYTTLTFIIITSLASVSHLIKYKQKTFAIISLIMSFLFILIYLIVYSLHK